MWLRGIAEKVSEVHTASREGSVPIKCVIAAAAAVGWGWVSARPHLSTGVVNQPSAM